MKAKINPRTLSQTGGKLGLRSDDINELTWAINSTPRKCLGFKTPAEAFLENMNVALEM